MYPRRLAKIHPGRAFATLLLLCLTSGAWAERVSVEKDMTVPDADLSSVNKAVRVGARSVVGDVSTVNGSIRLRQDSQARHVESVNGGIEAQMGASMESVEAVNGGIRLDENVTVARSIETVNGGVHVASGGQIGGNIKTINGGIRLESVVVQGDVETFNGEIDLRGSEILGDLRVKKPKMGNWGGWKKHKPTKVTIGAGTVVHGDLIFDKAVRLSIHESAQVGEVIGDKVEMVRDSRMK